MHIITNQFMFNSGVIQSTIKARTVSIDMSIIRRTQFEISFDLPFLLHSDPVIRYLTYKCYPYPPVKSAYF